MPRHHLHQSVIDRDPVKRRSPSEPASAAQVEAEALLPTAPATSSSVTLHDATGRFFALLSHLGCSLALSTDETRLILIGATNGQASIAALVLPHMRGLASQGDLIAVGSSDGVHVYKATRALAPVAPYAPATFDAVYVPRAIQLTGRCDFHDMAFVHGAIVAVNTRYSCVCVVDGRYSFTPIWKPPFITEVRPEDRCHLNGMAIASGQLRYVTMLGISNEPGGWRHRFIEDGGVLMEAATAKILASGLSLPHSPRIIGDRLLVLESGRGQLQQVDPESGERRILARLPGFTHGLCVEQGVLFIGLSKLRSRRPERRLPLETEGTEPICGVAALDARTHELIATLQITAGVEEVYDLQLLPGVRRPDIRTMNQWREHHAIELPEEAFWATEPEAFR